MGIRKNCAYWIIWILKIWNESKNLLISKFDLNKGCLTTFSSIIFTKIFFFFIIKNFSGNKVILNTSIALKKNQFCVYQKN